MLVLSLFPGIGLLQAEICGCGDSALDHRVMIRAEYPDILARGVLSASRCAVSWRFVVQVHHTRLAADHTGAQHVGIAQKESRSGGLPCRVFVCAVCLACVWIALMELLARVLDRCSSACIRAILSFPVKTINAREDRSAYAASPLLIRLFVFMRAQVDFAAIQLLAALNRAGSLVATLWHVCRAALRTYTGLVIDAFGLPLLQPCVMPGNEPIPIKWRSLGAANRKAATAAAKRWGGVCVIHGSIIPQTR